MNVGQKAGKTRATPSGATAASGASNVVYEISAGVLAFLDKLLKK